MTLYINQLQQTTVVFQVNEKWKGRIDQMATKKKAKKAAKKKH